MLPAKNATSTTTEQLLFTLILTNYSALQPFTDNCISVRSIIYKRLQGSHTKIKTEPPSNWLDLSRF